MISFFRVVFMIIWGFSLMLIAPIIGLLLFNRQFPLMVARTFFSPIFLKIAGAKIEINGQENVNQNKPAIFVANHCSHLDIGCMCRAIPVNLYFIGKKELLYVPVLGWYMFIAGHIWIDRSNRKKSVLSLRNAATKIRSGKNVILFPEGTRSATGKIGDFKKGAFHLALDAGVDIVPVHIDGTFRIWPKHTFLKVTPGKVTVNIGKPISSSNYSKSTVRDFVADTKSAMENLKA